MFQRSYTEYSFRTRQGCPRYEVKKEMDGMGE